MKSIKKYIYMSFCMLLGAVMAACSSDDNSNSLNISGNCLVETIEIGGYQGTINYRDYTINIPVPENTPLDNMEINTLKLSAGATANMTQGQHINLTVPRAIEVINGNLKQVWALSAKIMRTYITKFTINGINAVIDNENNTVTVYLKNGTDVSYLKPEITTSEGATVEGDGIAVDLSSPKTYTVTSGTSTRTYTVKVVLFDAAEALFIGAADSPENLLTEESAAYKWMYANVPMTDYASLKQIADGTVSLDGVKLIFWHLAKDGAIDGHDPFMAYVANATGIENNMDALNAGIFGKLKAYYENGGAMFLTRYAAILPPFLGTSLDKDGGWVDTWATPNNCWQGRNEDDPEFCGGPWTFTIFGDDNIKHPLFQNLVGGGSKTVFCTDEGYGITNSVVCYNHSEGWSEYSGDNGYNHWNERVQGRILGVNDEGAGNIIAWEFKSKTTGEYGKGGIVCLGTGCYDWYAEKTDAKYNENYHKNIAIISANACNYLLGK